MIKLAYDCAKIGLSGFEFMGGIPGNIGGGIFMNAGAYKSCLSKVVKSVKVLDEHLKVVELSKDEMDFHIDIPSFKTILNGLSWKLLCFGK